MLCLDVKDIHSAKLKLCLHTHSDRYNYHLLDWGISMLQTGFLHVALV